MKTSKHQLRCIIINLLIFKSFTSFPRLYSDASGTGAWLLSLIAGIIAFLLIFFILGLCKDCQKKDITELSKGAFGKTGAYICFALLSVFLLFSAVFALDGICSLTLRIAMPKSPSAFVALFILIPSAFAAYKGITAILKAHAVIVPIVLLITLIVIISAFTDGKLCYLFPMLGGGAETMLKFMLSAISAYADIVVLLIVNPFSDDIGTIRKNSLFAAAAAVLINIFVVILFTMTNPYPVSEMISIPIYQLIKTVSYGRFFQRIDAIYLMFILMSGMLYISTLLYALSKILGKTFSLGEYRPSVWVFASLVFVVEMTISANVLTEISSYGFMFLTLCGLILPIIIFGVLKLRRIKQ